MEEQLIQFETAKLAKEKGFNEDCLYHYDPIYNQILENSVYNKVHVSTHHLYANTYDFKIERWGGGNKNCIAVPSQALLQKWLREIYKLHITIYSSSQESWMYRITKPGQSLEEGLYDEDFEDYEECLEYALQEALKLI